MLEQPTARMSVAGSAHDARFVAAHTLLAGPIPQTLLRNTLPMLTSTGLIGLQSIAETYFVARLGPKELEAFGFISPVVVLFANLLMGAASGLTSAVSRAHGAQNGALSSACISAGLAVAVLFTGCSCTVGLCCWSSMFSLLGAPAHSQPLIGTYIVPWFWALAMQASVLFMSAALRGAGYVAKSANLLILAGLSSAALSPLLMFGAGPIPRFGLAGAAYAIGFGYLGSTLCGLRMLSSRGLLPKTSFGKTVRDTLRSILSVSVPAAVTYSLPPAGTMAATWLLTRYGSAAVAGFGVAMRLQTFIMLIPLAMSSAAAPFIGMNWGAVSIQRVRAGTAFMCAVAASWGTAIGLLLILSRAALSKLFGISTDVQAALDWSLLILPLAYAPASVLSILTAFFNAIGQASQAMLATFLRGIGLALPLAAIGGNCLGAPGVYTGLGAATLVSAVYAGLVARTRLRLAPSMESST